MKVFTSKPQQLGQKGEELAVVFLMKQGFSIIERNVAGTRGEIDIVAKKGSVTYFFEVKTGKVESWFNPADNLTPEKLRKFTISAQYYAVTHRIKDYRMGAIIVKIAPDGEGELELLDLT